MLKLINIHNNAEKNKYLNPKNRRWDNCFDSSRKLNSQRRQAMLGYMMKTALARLTGNSWYGFLMSNRSIDGDRLI
jgi:hypothetical protein